MRSFFLKALRQMLSFYSCSIVTDQQSTGLLWRWEKEGLFSTRSAYVRMHHRVINCRYQQALWKIKAQPGQDFYVVAATRYWKYNNGGVTGTSSYMHMPMGQALAYIQRLYFFSFLYLI